MTMKIQQQILFNGHPYSHQQRLWWSNPANPDCPLSKFIGNEEALRRLQRAAFQAFGRPNHCCATGFAFYGPGSVGKTTLAKLFAETLMLPFVSVEPQSIDSLHDLFELIKKELTNPIMIDGVAHDVSLVENDGKYILPPIVIFIDEVHNLKSRIEQGLLKATEPKDRMMVTEKGAIIDCTNVCWIIATTERGDMFQPFDSRFQKINLRLYTRVEMAKIVKLANSDFPDKVCAEIARYCPQLPREAIAFANDLRIEVEMSEASDSWTTVIKRVAADHGIDEFGMTLQRLEILKALGQCPVSAAQLPFVTQTNEAELQKFILPPLQTRTPDQPMPLVMVSSKGYTITPAGLDELNRRKIPNVGIQAMPEQTRQVFEALMGKSDTRMQLPVESN